MTHKSRGLTAEEQALWNQVARSIDPLNPETKRTPQPPSKTSSRNAIKREAGSSPLPQFLTPQHTTLPSVSHRIKRIRKVTIEARLDLHGLTRDQAQHCLSQFLISCQEQRFLWVLVITGKGRRQPGTDGCPSSLTKLTLRECVPEWLDTPPLGLLVAAYATAKPTDGGTGALYVRLKRKL